MTTQEKEEAMALLAQAKRGDEGAHRQLVDLVSRRYAGMITNWYTNDPMVGKDDLMQEFYWGIWRAVDIADHRGDPIFHLAQRGLWAVMSVVTAINRRRHGTTAKEGGISVVSLDTDEHNWYGPSEDSFEEQVCDLGEQEAERKATKERFQRLAGSKALRPSHITAIEKIMEHHIDLSQLGARRQLAKILGVSGQRVSVIMKQIEQIAETEGAAA